MTIEGKLHIKIEWFNDHPTCERSTVDCRFSIEDFIRKAKAYMVHFKYKKACIFVNVPYEDTEKELASIMEPLVTIKYIDGYVECSFNAKKFKTWEGIFP